MLDLVFILEYCCGCRDLKGKFIGQFCLLYFEINSHLNLLYISMTIFAFSSLSKCFDTFHWITESCVRFEMLDSSWWGQMKYRAQALSLWPTLKRPFLNLKALKVVSNSPLCPFRTILHNLFGKPESSDVLQPWISQKILFVTPTELFWSPNC